MITSRIIYSYNADLQYCIWSLERIAAESTGITADTALRLSKALGTSAQLWLNLQNSYDVKTAERAIGKQLAKIARVTADAAA